MAKRNNKADGSQRFCRLLQEEMTRLVGARSAEIDLAVDYSQVGMDVWSISGKILTSPRTWGKDPWKGWRSRTPWTQAKHFSAEYKKTLHSTTGGLRNGSHATPLFHH